MSRPLRLELGGIYHVTSRGNRLEDIYVDETDCIQWLTLLDQVCKRFNWRCHAYLFDEQSLPYCCRNNRRSIK